MASTTVKLSRDAHGTLASLASRREQPMSQVLAEIIEREERRVYFEEVNAAYARLRADPDAWADWQAEIKSMEGTMMDGLEDDLWVE